MVFSYFQSSILYLSMLLITFLLTRLAEKSNKFFPLVGVILMYVLVAGLRANTVGIDTKNYIAPYIDGTYKYQTNKGFVFVTDLFIGWADPNTYIFGLSLIIYTLIVVGIWKLRDRVNVTVMMTFFFMGMYLPSLNIMKQYLAFSFICFSIHFVFKKRYFLFLIFIAIATTIHFVSILSLLFLILYFLCYWNEQKIETKKLIILTVVVLVVGLAIMYPLYLKDIIDRKIKAYLSNVTFTFGLFGIFQLIVCFAITFMYTSNVRKENSNDAFYLSVLMLIGAIGVMAGYFYKYLNRLFSNFMIFEFAALSLFWKKVDGEQVVTTRFKPLYQGLALFMIIFPFISILVRDGYGVMEYGMYFW